MGIRIYFKLDFPLLGDAAMTTICLFLTFKLCKKHFYFSRRKKSQFLVWAFLAVKVLGIFGRLSFGHFWPFQFWGFFPIFILGIFYNYY